MGHLLTQSNRCTHLANRIAAQLRGHTSGAKLQGLQQDITCNTAAIQSYLDKERTHGHMLFHAIAHTDAQELALDTEGLDGLLGQDVFGYPHVFALRKAAARYQRLHKLNAQASARQKAQSRKPSTRSLGRMCKLIKGSSASPLLRARVKLPDGKFAIKTRPEEIDEAVITAWKAIFQGNLGPHSKQRAFDVFMETYGKHFKAQKPFAVEALTGQKILDGIEAMLDNSPGLDGVLAGDLKAISPLAADWLASMLNATEKGAKWPAACNPARIAYLDKGGDTLDPLC